MAVDPVTHTAYVTNERVDNTVSVIDEATNTVTATIAVGSDPYGVAVDPTTHTVYTANYNDDTSSGSTSPPTPSPPRSPSASGPYGVAVDTSHPHRLRHQPRH